MSKNTLAIVGTGIKFMSHLTVEAKTYIKNADKVLYLVNEPAMKDWIKSFNPSSESLDFLYTKHCSRNDNYKLISEYVLENLQNIKLLCLVIYGHPTVLVQPSIYSANMAIRNGHEVIMLPGISSEDCLFADLGIDPGSCGCQSFEATDFLIYDREYDSSCHLILWQPSVIGLKDISVDYDPKKGLNILTEHLNHKYDLSHEISLYEASQYPALKPKIEKIKLKDLPEIKITRITTLYVPPNVIKKPNSKILKKFNESGLANI